MCPVGKTFGSFSKCVSFKFGLSLQNQVSGFQKKFSFVQVKSFSGGKFPNFIGLKIGSCFWLKKFRFKLARVSAQPPVGKIGFMVFGQSFGKQVFLFGKVCFGGLCSVWQNQVSKIGFKVLAKVSASLV